MSELQLCPLRSSSKGNSTIIYDDTTKILVDCGISGKVLAESLALNQIAPEEINAILVTHEHSDHIKGVGVISRKYNIPVYANEATWQAMAHQLGKISDDNIRIFETGNSFSINEIRVHTFHTPHDAAESVGYVFENKECRVAVATDMGFVTDEVLNAIQGCNSALIEANYDPNMLEIGTYPYELKRRIKSNTGHLCNNDSGALAQILAENGTREIILGHLSEENNFPQLALKTVENFVFGACNHDGCRLSVVTRDGNLLSAV